MSFKYDVGIYIGRFQFVHLGHLKTFEVMAKMCNTLIASIGSANRPRTIENPRSAEEREQDIRKAIAEYMPDFDQKRLKFQYINDYMYNNNKWSAEVYSSAQMNGATSDKKVCLFGHFKDDSSFYLNMFPQWSLHTVINYKNINATDIRNDFLGNRKLSQESMDKLMPSTIKTINEFLETDTDLRNFLFAEYDHRVSYAKSWESAPYQPTFVTVDALVIKSGHVLLIQRGGKLGHGLYALPGGFLNRNEFIKDGIIRELKEETKIKVSKEELELRRDANSITIFDHPKRSKRGRTITHVGVIDLGEGPLPEIKAADDAKTAQWVPLSMVMRMSDKMFEDHFDIIVALTSKF